jgi:hypothetical protein
MNATIATVSPDEIAVEHRVRPDVSQEFLTIDVPNLWDDVKKLTKKVLIYDGRRFTFRGWNSDTAKCWFSRPLDPNYFVGTAKIVPLTKKDKMGWE